MFPSSLIILSILINFEICAAEIIKSETLTPKTSSPINGINLLTQISEVRKENPEEWNIFVLYQRSWQFIFILDDTWGFNSEHESSISFTVNAPQITIPKFDNIILGFSVNNYEYISIAIPIGNINNNQMNSNKIYPNCFPETKSEWAIGDIARIPYYNRMCDVAGGNCENWQNMKPENFETFNTFPVTVLFQNNPNTNTMQISFHSLSSNIQTCVFTNFPANEGLKIYLGGNASGQQFDISSFDFVYRVKTATTTEPTLQPTTNPSNPPTKSPISNPTFHPTLNPTTNPILKPTMSPTNYPTLNPVYNPTVNPSFNPIYNPTLNPALNPTINPTLKPSSQPTFNPSSNPSVNPSFNPTYNPTLNPALNPTINPTLKPSSQPTFNPSSNPSDQPTFNPTLSPSFNPSSHPTTNPTLKPTFNPSSHPTLSPSSNPSLNPSSNPSYKPTFNPSTHPSFSPSSNPSYTPTFNPSIQPSFSPSSNPSAYPTFNPSLNPTFNPTFNPTPREWRDIYYDNMEINNGWFAYNQVTFGDAAASCPNTDTCVLINGCKDTKSRSGASYIEKIIDVTGYESIRLKIDVTVNDMETGNQCEIYYAFGSETEKEIVSFSVNDMIYINHVVNLPHPTDANLKIKLQARGDSKRKECTDRCYYDNLHVQGLPSIV